MYSTYPPCQGDGRAVQSEMVFDKIMPVKLALIASTLLMPFFSFAQAAAPHVVNTASELAGAIFGKSFKEGNGDNV